MFKARRSKLRRTEATATSHCPEQLLRDSPEKENSKALTKGINSVEIVSKVNTKNTLKTMEI